MPTACSFATVCVAIADPRNKQKSLGPRFVINELKRRVRNDRYRIPFRSITINKKGAPCAPFLSVWGPGRTVERMLQRFTHPINNVSRF